MPPSVFASPCIACDSFLHNCKPKTAVFQLRLVASSFLLVTTIISFTCTISTRMS